jgi:acyl dehydratase
MSRSDAHKYIGAYEDYKIGKKVILGSYVLTSSDIIEFAKKWDPAPFHTDEKAGQQSVFGSLTAAGAHLISIRIKLIQDMGVNPHIIATMGWDQVKFLNPAKPKDTLILSFECIEKRLSKSKPDCGIVTMYFEMINQNNDPILSLNDTILVRRRHN